MTDESVVVKTGQSHFQTLIANYLYDSDTDNSVSTYQTSELRLINNDSCRDSNDDSLKLLLTAVLRVTTLKKENYYKKHISLVVKRFLFTARLTVITLDERERMPSADLSEIFWDKDQSWDTNSVAPQQGRTPNDNISKLSFRREFGIVGSFVVRSLARSCLTSVSNASLNL